MGQRLNWSSIDENQSHFGFVGYQGGRKNACTDRSGNLIYCSPFANFIHVDSQQHTANFETLIVKRDKDGHVLWSRTLSGTGFKSGHSIHADSLGNIYLLGWYYGNSSINGVNLYSYGNYDCFVVKLSSAGQILYTRTFGGAGYDYPFALTTDWQGNAYIAGKFSFTIQSGALSAAGGANSHFLLKLLPNGNVSYIRNTCTSGAGDWGKGDLAMGKDGKLYLVSNYFNTSVLDTVQLQNTGAGGYLAKIEPATGRVEKATKAGSEACLIDVGLSGELIIGGWHRSNLDSIASSRLPNLTGASEYYLARLTPQMNLVQSTLIKRNASGLTGQEDFRQLHIGTSGQLFLSGDLVGDFQVGNQPVQLIGYTNGSATQGALIKLEENLSLAWSASVSSQDTLGVPNPDFGCGIATDLQGNIFWLTSNFANSVQDTRLYLNQDTTAADTLKSRYKAYGIHIWSLSEPYIATQNTSPLVVCPGDSLPVNFLKYGIFDPGNVFQVELSDSNGSFEFARVLGQLADTAADTIHVEVPFDLHPGQYHFRVNGSNPRVKGSATELPIQVRGKPNAFAGNDVFFCLGDTVELGASGGGSYDWSGTAPLLDSFQAQVRALPGQDASFMVKVTDSLSSCYNLDTVEYRYRRQVFTQAIADTVLCAGQVLVAKIHLLDGDSAKLTSLWKDENGQVLSTADSLVLVPNRSMRIFVEVWDSCSLLSDTQSFHITLRDPLSIELVSDTLLCQNQASTLIPRFEGGDSLNYAYEWRDSASGQQLSLNAVLQSSFSSAQTLQVKLSDACTVQPDSVYIHVVVPDPLQVSLLDSLWLCPGDSVLLNASTQGGYPNSLLYQWGAQSPVIDSQYWWKPTSTSGLKLKLSDYCQTADSAEVFATLRTPKSLLLRADTLICQGETVLAWLTGFESDTAQYSFQWDGFAWGQTQVFYTPDSSFYPRLRIRDNCSLQAFYDSFFIDVRPELHLQVPVANPYCYGEQVTLNALPSGGLPAQYQLAWYDENGAVATQGLSWSIRVRDSLKAYVVLEDLCSRDADTAFIHLTTHPPLSWSQVADTQLCFGQFLALTPVLSGGLGTNYSWSLSAPDSLTLVQGQAYAQSRLVEIIGRDGCSDEDTLQFLIQVSEPLHFDKISDTLLCYGSDITLTAVPEGGLPLSYTFTWQGLVGTNTKQINNLLSDTSLTLCLGDGCSVPYCDSVQLTLFDRNLARIEGDTQSCFPDPLSWAAEYKQGGGSWRWVIPGQLDTVSQLPGFSWNVPKSGDYQLLLTQIDQNGCDEQSGMRRLRSSPKPNAYFYSKVDFVVPGQKIELLSDDQSVVSHRWEGGAIPVMIGSQRFEVEFPDSGRFDLMHIALNREGCADSFSVSFDVKDSLKCWLPNAFIPKADGAGLFYAPVCTELADMSWQIYNRWGQLIFEAEGEELKWNAQSQDGTPLPIGVYVYRFQASNQRGERVIYSGIINLIR